MGGGKEGVGNSAGSFRKIFAHGWEHDAFVKVRSPLRSNTVSFRLCPSLSADPRVYMCVYALRIEYRRKRGSPMGVSEPRYSAHHAYSDGPSPSPSRPPSGTMTGRDLLSDPWRERMEGGGERGERRTERDSA